MFRQPTDQDSPHENTAAPDALAASVSEDLRYLMAFNDKVLNVLPDGFAIIDSSYQLRSANRAFREMAGIESDENSISLADNALWEAKTPDGETLRAQIEQLLDETDDMQRSLPAVSFENAGGEMAAHPVRLALWDRESRSDRRVLIWFGAGEVGESEEGADGEAQAHAHAQSEDDLTNRLFDHLAASLCEVGPGLFIERTNAAFNELMDRPFDEDSSARQHLFRSYPELDTDAMHSLVETCVETGQSQSGRAQIKIEDRTREVAIDVLPSQRFEQGSGGVILLIQPDNDSTQISLGAINHDTAPEAGETAPEGGESTHAQPHEQRATPVDTIFAQSFPEPDRDAPPVNMEIEQLLIALNLLPDFDRLCDRVLGMGLSLTGGQSGSLMIVDEDRRELYIVASRGIADPIARSHRQRIGEGIAGRVAEKGDPMLLQGRIGDKRFKGVGGRPEICSALSVPVMNGNRVLGVMNLNTQAGDPFNEEQLKQTATLGVQVGAALAQSLQMQRMTRRSFELTVRAEIESIKFSGGSLQTKLQQVADRLSELLEFDNTSIYLNDPDAEQLVLRATTGYGKAAVGAVHVDIGSGIVGHVAKTQKPIVLQDLDRAEQGLDTQVVAGVPIQNFDGPTGVVYLEATERSEISREHMDLITAAAAAIGQLIGDVKSSENSSKKLTMLSALSEMSVAFTAARDRQALGRLVAFCGATVLESDIGTVRIADPGADFMNGDGDQFTLLASHGTAIPNANEELGRLETAMAEAAIERKEPVGHWELSRDDTGTLLREANIHGALSIPLLSGEECHGVIVVYRQIETHRDVPRFGEQDKEIGVRLGDYAGAAAARFAEAEMEAAETTFA